MQLRLAIILIYFFQTSFLKSGHVAMPDNDGFYREQILPGADQTEKYLSYLKGKRIGILSNQTSIIGKTHMVDSLKALSINIVTLFGPEHGFRGNASAGAKVQDEVDSATGIPIVSLYGIRLKPTKEHMESIDLMIFDLQDVGCRFYTNINVLARIMETCAENNKELLILDRPNPNGYLVDGPILDMKLKSGIGMFPIPHGARHDNRRICTNAQWGRLVNQWYEM